MSIFEETAPLLIPLLQISADVSSSALPILTTPTPISSSQPTFTEIVTKTELNHSLPAQKTVTAKGIKTLTIADSSQNHNNNKHSNTINTAAIVLSIMICFVIVGGCITLIITRKKTPVNRKKKTNNVQRNLYGEDPDGAKKYEKKTVYSQIRYISPPLNLPPPRPRRSPPPPLQRYQTPPPRHSLPSPPPPPPPRHSLPLPPTPPPRHSPPPPPRSPSLPPSPSLPLISQYSQYSPVFLYRNPSLTRNVSLMRKDSSTRNSGNNYDFHFTEYSPTRLDPIYHSQRHSQSRYPLTDIEEPP